MRSHSYNYSLYLPQGPSIITIINMSKKIAWQNSRQSSNQHESSPHPWNLTFIAMMISISWLRNHTRSE
jgi:hypothetical protein